MKRRKPRRAVIHSDQGTQYGTDHCRRFYKANHLEPSISRKGSCLDSAVAKSFFASLKEERIKTKIYTNRSIALQDIADYIESSCNSAHRHDHLGRISPDNFEAAVKRLPERRVHKILATPYHGHGAHDTFLSRKPPDTRKVLAAAKTGSADVPLFRPWPGVPARRLERASRSATRQRGILVVTRVVTRVVV